ncbi:MAG: hypothetical protein AB1847_18130 [bacterium]
MIMIIIAGALYMEIQELISGGDIKKVTSWLWEGKYGQHPVQVIKTGVGKEKAKKTLNKALLRCDRDCFVINIGLAGALNPSLEVGSIVAARKVCEVADDGGARYLSLMTDAPLMNGLSAIESFSLGTLLTVSQAANREKKRSLRQQYPEALAVDMESFHIAELCQERHIPVMILRAVSDELSFQVPEDSGSKKAAAMQDPAQGAESLQWAALYRYCRQAAKANIQALGLYLKCLGDR